MATGKELTEIEKVEREFARAWKEYGQPAQSDNKTDKTGKTDKFDSTIDSEFIGEEYGDTSYHTVVTVLEPDTMRDSFPYDYTEELLSNPNNKELEIKRGQPARSATRGKHPNTSSELPFDHSISQTDGNVNKKFSLSSIANTFHGDPDMSSVAFEESDYKQTDGYINETATFGFKQRKHQYRSTRT